MHPGAVHLAGKRQKGKSWMTTGGASIPFRRIRQVATAPTNLIVGRAAMTCHS